MMRQILPFIACLLVLPLMAQTPSKTTNEKEASDRRLEELRAMRDEYFRQQNSTVQPKREGLKKPEEPKETLKPQAARPVSRLADGALSYLLSVGWKRYACRVVNKGTQTFLVVSDGLSTWATEAPILFPILARECLGKDAILSGPNEIICDDGSHHQLLLADWRELR